MIVDTHVHVVSGDRTTYPVAEKAPNWPLNNGETLLALMDQAGIDRALLVQTYFTYHYDNRYLSEVVLSYPDRFLGVCVLDPLSPAAPDELENQVRHRGVRGIRLMNDRAHNVISIDDPRTFPLWERIGALGIPVCIASLIDDVARVRVPLERFPGVKVAIDHIWGLKVGDPPAFERLKPVLDLAPFPNLYVKIAVNNSFALRDSKASPEQFYGLLVERFGVKRIMWGSNYPAHSQLHGTLVERKALAIKDLSFLSEEERGWILGETALTLWPALRRWGPSGAPARVGGS
jgi:L-fuconolactonase